MFLCLKRIFSFGVMKFIASQIDALKDELEKRESSGHDNELVTSLREQIATLEEKLEQEAK